MSRRCRRSLGAIRAFAPLARTIDATQPTTGYEDVKRIAISRVLADNVDTIQVDWALYGPKLAQVALTFGADDIDSVAADDDQSQGRRRSPRRRDSPEHSCCRLRAGRTRRHDSNSAI